MSISGFVYFLLSNIAFMIFSFFGIELSLFISFPFLNIIIVGTPRMKYSRAISGLSAIFISKVEISNSFSSSVTFSNTGGTFLHGAHPGELKSMITYSDDFSLFSMSFYPIFSTIFLLKVFLFCAL